MTTVVECTNEIKEYGYDRNGNRAFFGLVIGSANTYYIKQDYVYDPAFRLVELIDYDPYNSSILSDTTYIYDNNGNLLSETTWGVTKTEYTYNEANLVTSVENYGYISGSWSLVSSFEYTYYTDGNQRTKYDSTRSITTTYTYDGAGRLLTEIEILGGNLYQSYAYTYDHAGNRLTLTAEGTNELYTEYTYNAANQLTVEETTAGEDTTVIEYAYDVNGNLLTKTKDSVVTDSYRYDAKSRLASYTGTQGTFEYLYNTVGLRKSKVYGSGTNERIKYIHDWSGRLIFDFNLSDPDSRTIYVYGLRLIASAQGIDDGISMVYQTVYFYVQNAHGDVVQLLDPTDNTVTKSYIYDAFGNELDPLSTDTNYFRYCGEYLDYERGEYYLRARCYDPRTGRFTQEDPIRYGLNLYVYCANSPITFIDPSGCIIQLQGTAEEQKYILDHLGNLTNYILSLNEDGTVSYSYPEGNIDTLYKSGNELLKRMIDNNNFTCTIKLGLTNSGNAVDKKNARNNGNGSDYLVQFDDIADPDILTKDPSTGCVSEAKRPAYIGLAHELIHADRAMRGVQFAPDEKDSYIYKVRTRKYFLFVIPYWKYTYVIQYERMEELATVGLASVNKGDITENMIRAEHGLRPRGAY